MKGGRVPTSAPLMRLLLKVPWNLHLWETQFVQQVLACGVDLSSEVCILRLAGWRVGRNFNFFNLNLKLVVFVKRKVSIVLLLLVSLLLRYLFLDIVVVHVLVYVHRAHN